LALRVASEVAHAFRDGVWLVELGPLEDDMFLAQRVADTFEVRKESTQAQQQVLAEFLAGKDLLLILDNCEHLVRASQVLVSDLLRTCAGLRVLATSRQPLRAPEAWLFDVPPLSVREGEQPLSAGQTAADEAVRLFADRAQTALPGLTVEAANQETVVRLCQRLGVSRWPLSWLPCRCGRCRRNGAWPGWKTTTCKALGAGARASLQRQQTLQAAIDWSFELCSNQEQRVWARASVLRGGFDLHASERVCSGAGVDRDEMLGLISGLVTNAGSAERIQRRFAARDHRYRSDSS
jgi:predicted ATPase